MRSAAKPFLISAAIVAVLVALLMWQPRRRSATSLLVYCAAGIQNPVAEIARQYEEEYGVQVELQYGGSGTLLNNLRVSKTGDLYIAADASYVDRARELKLIDEAIPLAYQRPVIAVQKGNPAKIKGVKDLLRDDVKTSLANPSAASVGRQTKILMEKLGYWAQLEEAVRTRGVFKPTVNEVANDVKIGAVQAGITWDATVNQYPELEIVPIAGSDDFIKCVTVSVLKATEDPTAALRFARYLGARDRGLKTFARMGFPAVDGDAWAETPEIVYFSGGVNRLAVQDTLKAFGRREGVSITTVFNSCGILNGTIKQGAAPDGYQTCDLSFMKGVGDKFGEAVNITEMDMVILAKREANIKTLKDLGRRGLKVGLANEKQSALGALAARLLKEQGLYDAVVRNVASRTPTADMLVVQIRAGSLDAVVVYRVNATKIGSNLEIIDIPLREARAIQTFAIGKDTKYPQLMQRLYDAIRSVESQRRFTQTGFRWLGEGETP
jgi:molybdate transport system substrate-binding protein